MDFLDHKFYIPDIWLYIIVIIQIVFISILILGCIYHFKKIKNLNKLMKHYKELDSHLFN